jgi:hypothetical protein
MDHGGILRLQGTFRVNIWKQTDSKCVHRSEHTGRFVESIWRCNAGQLKLPGAECFVFWRCWDRALTFLSNYHAYFAKVFQNHGEKDLSSW